MNKTEQLKQFHKNPEKIRKYSSGEVKEVKNRVLRFVGSTERIDRDQEVIKVNGWKLDNYLKSPVILVNHQYHELPVAKAVNVWVDKNSKALMFDVEFPTSDISATGDTLYKLYKNGYMSATSVGFKANVEKIEYGKTASDPRVVFNEQELLELSLVSVGSNPDALLTSKSIQEAIKNDVVDELEIGDLELFLKSLDKSDEEIPEIIEKQTDDVVKVEKNVKEEDPKKEKNINTIKMGIYECNCPKCNKNFEIELTCPECSNEEQDDEIQEYFEKLYNDIIFERSNKSDSQA